jgi:hypothetical protein
VGMTERSDELSRKPEAEPLPLPRTEQLVHAVTVESLETAGAARDSAPVPSMVSYPPDGQVARVRDELSQQGDAWVHTPGGLLRVTRLRRRPSPVTGLPPAVPGVRYLVSRITAQAARDRADLVFPFGERRDNEGRVTDVSGLGAFDPDRRLADRYREWQRAAAERRARRPLAAEWRTGLLFALATALLSAWLGLFPGNVDNALKNGWGGGGQAWTTWLGMGFLVLGAAFLTQAARRWYWGQKVRAERGTAYVIEEQAIAWRHEEKQWVLDQLAGEFATVLRVPGPEALGERWRWQGDERGAPEWDRRTDQLVHSFWAVHYNDDQVTRNAVFVWAPWPVAMAFGAWVTARRRGLVLHVRQRPSSGNVGRRHELRLDDPAHDFLRAGGEPMLAPAAPPCQHLELTAPLKVTIKTLRDDRAAAPEPHSHKAAFPPVRLLLVRIVRQDIGTIPLDLAAAPAVTVHAPRCLTGSVLRPGPHELEAAEWRWSGPGGAAEIPWGDFPATAEAIASWVIGQAAAHEDHVLLLAARMPQEIAVGLGIQLGQRQPEWPQRLYPVHFVGGELVVPDLDLGRHSVPPEQK